MHKNIYEEIEEEEEVKWAKHYSSVHQILLVGEGDFSFSLSLANAFGSASNIVATSRDSCDMLYKKYSKAQANVDELKKMGATIMHEVDATKMKFHVGLRTRKFDRIVYNFPHAGFKGKEENLRLIELHRKLVLGFFKNAGCMLRTFGEVHVSHKTAFPFSRWNLEELASMCSLVLAECAKFCIADYPGYNNKRGDGSRCDRPFPLGECSTFKFVIGHVRRKRRPVLIPAPPFVNSMMVNNYCHGNSGDVGYPDMHFPIERTSIIPVERVPRSISTLPAMHGTHGHEFRGMIPPIGMNYLGPRMSERDFLIYPSRIMEPPCGGYDSELVEQSRRMERVQDDHGWSFSSLEHRREVLVRYARFDDEDQHRWLFFHHGW